MELQEQRNFFITGMTLTSAPETARRAPVHLKSRWLGTPNERLVGVHALSVLLHRLQCFFGFRAAPMFTLLCGVWLCPASAYAVALEFHSPVTYNMQGGTAGDQSKWTNDVARLCQTHDVVLLQEAGPTPPESSQTLSGGQLGGFPLTVARWNIGRSGDARTPDYRYVYFLQTDPSGGRVNLAIVLRQQADQFQLAQGGLPGQSRPALGIRLGAMWFYTVHGLSGSGNDDRQLLQNISSVSSPYYWTAMGDYNRDPSSLTAPSGTRIYSSGQATQINGSELDYAVSNDIVECGSSVTNTRVVARRLNGLSADHFPVDLIAVPCPLPKAPSAALPDKHLAVMPLGDSITAGFQSSNNTGYRQDLQTELDGAGVSFEYVGSESIGAMSNPQNEGHYGYRIDQISAITTAAVSRYNPDVVLLHAGTNDMNQNYQVSTAPGRLHDLIDQIYNAAPDTTILVSRLILSPNPTLNARIQAFNESISRDVTDLQAQGKRIALVDMSEVTVADMYDTLHPNDNGYQKMANAWDDALVTALECIDIVGRANIGPRGNPGPVAPPPPEGKWSDEGIIASGVGADPKTSQVRFADLNGDGRADYLVVHSDGSVDAWLNVGGDASGKPGWIAAGRIAGGVGVPGDQIQFADVNGDGRVDYLAVHDDGSVDAWMNTGGDSAGKPGWIAAGRIAGGVGAPGADIQFADINGDGFADYLVVDSDTGAVDAWMNIGGDSPGKPGWEAYGRIASGVRSSASQSLTRFADLNNDGYADYVIISKVNGAVSAYINGGGKPRDWIWIPIGQIAPGDGIPSPYHQIQEADINGDGKADYLKIDERGAVHAWLNNGRDTTPVAGWLPTGEIAGGVGAAPGSRYILADMNNDGRADYIVVNPTTAVSQVWLNGGSTKTGWLWIQNGLNNVVRAPGGRTYTFADINGDGMADFLAVDPHTGAIQAWQTLGQLAGSSGAFNFLTLGEIASGVSAGDIKDPGSHVLFADINGDGRADYIVVDPVSGTGYAWLNGGPSPSGNWIWYPVKNPVTFPTGAHGYFYFADINGDRKADFLIVQNDGSVLGFLNEGQKGDGWSWSGLGKIASGVAIPGTTRSIRFADLDGDGRADYIVLDPTIGAIPAAYLYNGG